MQKCKSRRFDPWIRKIPWRRAWQPTPVFWPGEVQGQRSLAGYSPRGHKELDTTKRLSVLDSPVAQTVESAYNAGDLGLIPGSRRSPGKGNGNLLQYSCLENPRNGGAWQATVHGVAKSWTRPSDFTFFLLSMHTHFAR